MKLSPEETQDLAKELHALMKVEADYDKLLNLKAKPNGDDDETLIEELDSWIDPWVIKARKSPWTPFYVGLFWCSGALFGFIVNHYYHMFIDWMNGIVY